MGVAVKVDVAVGKGEVVGVGVSVSVGVALGTSVKVAVGCGVKVALGIGLGVSVGLPCGWEAQDAVRTRMRLSHRIWDKALFKLASKQVW